MEKVYIYKVYRSGVFLNTWNEVVSEPSWSQEMNNAGAEQKVTLARMLDDYGEGTDVDFGLDVSIHCFDGDAPDGMVLFTGFISSYTPVYGKDEVEVTLLSFGAELGQFMLQDAISQTGSVLDSNANVRDSQGAEGAPIYWSDTFGYTGRVVLPFTASAGMASIAAMDIHFNVGTDEFFGSPTIEGGMHPFGAVGNNRATTCPVIADIYEDTGGAIDLTKKVGSVTLPSGTLPYKIDETLVNATAWEYVAVAMYRFSFTTPLAVTPNKKYWIALGAPSDAGVPPMYIGNQTIGSYWMVYYRYVAQGNPANYYYEGNQGNNIFYDSWRQPIMDIWCGDGSTTVAFTGRKPSDIMKGIIDRYRGIGGKISYTPSSVDDCNTLVSYTFQVATIFDAIKKTLELAPQGWYWYVDVATNIFHFHKKDDTPNHTLSLETHIKELKPEKRIEDLVNTIYFTGGGVPALYKKYINADSVSKYGIKMQKYVDNRVIIEATAQTIANSILETKSQPEVRVNIEVVDNNGYSDFGYDIESVKVGDVIAIRNISQLVGLNVYDIARWDVAKYDFDLQNLASMNMQVLKIDYTPDSIKLQASSVPPDVAKRIEEINRSLEALQTADNPSIPS